MTTGNNKLAARLREMAATLQKDIDERRRPRLENTRRRAEMAASIREDARRMEKVQAALFGLAAAHERNEVPQVLANVTTKKQVEHLVHIYKPTVTEQAQKDALLALSNPAAGELTDADKIKELERQLVGRKIDGYFPTPSHIVKWMLQCADIQPGDRVLEPSAGKGNIADLVRELHPSAQLDVIECNYTLRGILIYKGHNLIAGDCLEVRNPIYNVVVMNPPFEKLADIDHVRHAYDNLLAPGGRLVSIMGESAFFRSDNKAMVFRQWLEEMGATIFNIPAGAFKESGTGVKTRMIVVDKAVTQQITTEEAIDQAVEQGLLPVAEENADPIVQFLDEDGDFIPLYPDDLEPETDEPQPITDEEINAMAAQMAAGFAAALTAASGQAYAEAQQAESEAPQQEAAIIIILPSSDHQEAATPEPQPQQIEAAPTLTTQDGDSRDIQKALPGFGNDKLIHLKRTRMF